MIRPRIFSRVRLDHHFVQKNHSSSLSFHLPKPFLSEALARNAPIDVHEEVAEALAHRRPVVALETALVTHGLPQPTNLAVARSCAAQVRAAGAVPATIGLVSGRVKIGMTVPELERLADISSSNRRASKISRRDIGPAIGLKMDGGTTIAGTLVFCQLAGIKVFATGGLGGVHRGGEISMDVSADLGELARCQTALLSGGIKSILDIGRTLEYLETLGVPVMTYSTNKDFPGFFSPRSGFKALWNSDDPATIASIVFSQWRMGMQNGTFIGVPIPSKWEAEGAEIQKCVDQAVRESEENGISKTGSAATPWLLQRTAELTQGRSIPSNVALLENTALIGGRVAVEYAKLELELVERGTHKLHPSVGLSSWQAGIRSAPIQRDAVHHAPTPASLVVVGCAALDVTARSDPTTDAAAGVHSTSPGSVATSLGGVGRNIAEAAHHILNTVDPNAIALIAPIASDTLGDVIVNLTSGLGMRTDGLIFLEGGRSAVCNMVLNSQGSLIGGIADMDIAKLVDWKKVRESLERLRPSVVACDGNISTSLLEHIVNYCKEKGLHMSSTDKLASSEPTSVIKCPAILPAIATSLNRPDFHASPVDCAAPNLLELAQLYRDADGWELFAHPAWWKAIDDMNIGSQFRNEVAILASHEVSKLLAPSFLTEQGVAQMAISLLPFFQRLIIKAGSRGVVVVMRTSGAGWMDSSTSLADNCVVAGSRDRTYATVLKYYPALKPQSIANVTGAGDTFVGSVLATLAQNPDAFDSPAALDIAVQHAQEAAVLTLQSPLAVSPLLSQSDQSAALQYGGMVL